MSPRRPAPGEVERALERAYEVQAQIERKERSLRRRTEDVARGLAAVMEPGRHLYRSGVGLHAFAVDGSTCLAAAYLEEHGVRYRYRYAVLCGGDAAVRALRTAELDPGDSDAPGRRRVALADYGDCDDFLYRLPMYVKDATKALEARMVRAEEIEQRLRDGRRLVKAAAKL